MCSLLRHWLKELYEYVGELEKAEDGKLEKWISREVGSSPVQVDYSDLALREVSKRNQCSRQSGTRQCMKSLLSHGFSSKA